jgi:hypothetical protein
MRRGRLIDSPLALIAPLDLTEVHSAGDLS